MDAVDVFGNTITRQFRGHPAFARRFLRFGYAVQQAKLGIAPDKRLLPSQRHLSQLTLRNIRRALAHPGKTALVNLFMPGELVFAMGLIPLCAEQYGAFLSGGKAEKGFLDFAEEKGVPETYCSYHKALLGALYAGVVERPRLVATTSTVCDANTNTFREASAYFGMPLHYIDVPMEESDETVSYVAMQLEKLTQAMEDELHRPFEYERLQQSVHSSNKSVRHARQFFHELETKYYPTAADLEMFHILASHILMGSPEAEEFYARRLDDIRGCPAISAKRIIWGHVLPWYADPIQKSLNFSEDYQLLTSDMNFDALIEIDEERPLEGIARRLILNHFNGSLERRTEAMGAMAERLNADGAILFCHFGCKRSNGAVYALRDSLQERGIQVLVLDGDGCDRRNMSIGQTETRMQAYLELLGSQATAQKGQTPLRKTGYPYDRV